MPLDLERPARVRRVYDMLLEQQHAGAISNEFGIADEVTRHLISGALNSHDSLVGTCTPGSTCLHTSWDMASEIVDIIDRRAG